MSQIRDAGETGTNNAVPVSITSRIESRDCVRHLVEEWCRAIPDAVAVAQDSKHLSYGMFDRLSTQLAWELSIIGAGPEQVVGILMPRSPELVISALAVWKTGAAYLPLDPSNPEERLAFMIRNVGARAVLKLAQLEARFSVPGTSVVDFESFGLEKKAERAGSPAVPIVPDSLAYVIYTSGSTGQPKGVAVEHSSLVNLICWHQKRYSVTAADRCTWLASPAFDASVWEIWSCLASGSSLFIPEWELLLSPPRLLEWLSDQQISLSFMPTPLAEAVLLEERASPLSLRFLLTGGDALHRTPSHRTPYQLFNHYGPTEGTVVTTSAQVDSWCEGTQPPIGNPISNVEVYLLDTHLQPVLAGEIGEICVGGLCLARGYLNRADLTGEKFIPNPIGSQPGARLYRTGDLGRLRTTGELEFLGRIDHQVKIRGVRIELGEIEAALKSQPALKDACVKVWEDGGDKKLVAYVVPLDQRAIAQSEISTELRRSLPEVMVPTIFVSLPELPVTPNGKLNRQALPPPLDQATIRSAIPIVPPRTQEEEILLGIWSSVLGIRCGVQDSFFDLGGHSLSAMQILVRVQETFGVDLEVRSLFAAPTVAELAELIAASNRSGAILSLTALADGDGCAPLSFGQQQFWILDQIEPGSPFYNEQVSIRITGAVSLPALSDSLSEIGRRHRVLTSRFAIKDGVPCQQPCEFEFDPPLINLEALPVEARNGEASRLLSDEALGPFDLQAGPLARMLLVSLADDEHLLLAAFHHAIFDGWSIKVLLRELAAVYAAVSNDIASHLPPSQFQYADYARWQRSWLDDTEIQRQLAYWRRQLADLPTIELPAIRPRPLHPTYRAGTCRFGVSPEVSQLLIDFGKREGATAFMIVLSAWSALLGNLAFQDDIPVGTAVAGRVRAELESMIGCFTSTLVMRIDLSGNPSFRELLARVRSTTLDAFAHQDVPFERLVEELQPQRELSRSPLFQVALVFQPNPPGTSVACEDVTFETMEEPGELVRFDLELHVWENQGSLSGRLSYRTELFDEQIAEYIVHSLETFLESAALRPDDNIERLLPSNTQERMPRPIRSELVNGRQVDLDRVETAIRSDPAVIDCVVLGQSDQQRSQRLTAYVVGSAPLDHELLAARLAESGLPDAAIPSVFIPVSSIPLTRSGEIDYDALASLEAIDLDCCQRWEETLKGVPGILQAAALIRETRLPAPPLHLADLLPSWLHRTVMERCASFSEPAAQSDEEPGSRRPAVSSGGSLHLGNPLPTTLAATLRRTSLSSSDKGILYIDAAGNERRVSYPEFLAEADRVLAGLRRVGLRAGDRVLFQLRDNLHFLIGFWACQLGGMVPVPAGIAPTYVADNAVVQKILSAWKLLEQPLVLTDQATAPMISSVLEGLNGLRIAAIEELNASNPDGVWVDGNSDDLALLLLTSGSTGTPKAVMHSHRTLLTRSAAEVQWNEFNQDDISLNWLPLDHVASLVQFHLRDVYLGCQEIQVATERILSDPIAWLDLIGRFRATVTWAPNFAFGLVNECAVEIAQRRWDLSPMRNLLNGGEAIVARTARRFLELLEPHGLPHGALHPVWGMSETAAGVTSSKRFLLATTDPSDQLVEVGEPLPEVSFRIVDAQDQPLEEGRIGRLQVQGATVTLGYYNSPEQTRDSFTQDGWFKTGDLGLLRDGRLTITGREKNVIIVNGANYYSHEIEAIVEEVNGVQISYTAAVAVRHSESDTDGLAIFFSPASESEASLGKLLTDIREQVIQKVGILPNYLLPIAPDEVPKTGIGKIQHSQLKQHLEQGEFSELIKRVDVVTASVNTVPNWFFRKLWRPRVAPATTNGFTGIWIVFARCMNLVEALISGLNASGATGITVTEGSCFRRYGPLSFTLDPGDPNGYRELLRILSAEAFTVGGVIHSWTYDKTFRAGVDETASSETELLFGVHSLLFLLQALAAKPAATESMRLLIASSRAQAVLANDDLACERAACLGLLKTARQEFPWISCRHVDLPGEDGRSDASFLLEEARLLKAEPEVAYRYGRRFVARLERITFSPEAVREPPLREGGRYLITGGLGGVGTTLASYLLREFKARLLVVGRSALPDRSIWSSLRNGDGPPADRVQKLLEWESLGGDVVYESVDVCDIVKLGQILSRAEEHWGAPLDGVFHLATAARGMPLMDETADGLSTTLAAKVTGTLALHRLVADRPGTLFVTFSSVNGFFGGSSVGAYAAANSFLDSFCHFQRRTTALASHCIAWSLWEGVGLSRGSEGIEPARALGYYAITGERGIQSLLAALAYDLPAVLVGLDETKRHILAHVETHNCQLAEICAFYTADEELVRDELARLQVRDRFGKPVLCELFQIDELPLTFSGKIDRAALAALATQGRREAHTRTEPRNQVERELAAIWRDLILVPEVFLEDSFFDLGGHSLLASQMLSRVRQTFGVELPLRDLFVTPTLGALANRISSAKDASAATVLESLVAEIEQLSADEIRLALEQSESSTGEAGSGT